MVGRPAAPAPACLPPLNPATLLPAATRSQLLQPVMWTLKVQEHKGEADGDLEEKACTPLRPA